MSDTILVTGGNGFIGAEICRLAETLGHTTVSVDRGNPPDSTQVQWVNADVLKPEQWRDRLSGCAALIHCVGTVEENPAEEVTYDRLNTQAASVALAEAVRAGVGKFVFLSTAGKPPFAPDTYLDSFRRAERAVEAAILPWAILRMSLVYGPRRPGSVVQATMMNATARLPGMKQKREGVRPLPVETVARAALIAALEPGVKGTLDIDAIEQLARDVAPRT